MTSAAQTGDIFLQSIIDLRDVATRSDSVHGFSGDADGRLVFFDLTIGHPHHQAGHALRLAFGRIVRRCDFQPCLDGMTQSRRDGAIPRHRLQRQQCLYAHAGVGRQRQPRIAQHIQPGTQSITPASAVGAPTNQIFFFGHSKA